MAIVLRGVHRSNSTLATQNYKVNAVVKRIGKYKRNEYEYAHDISQQYMLVYWNISRKGDGFFSFLSSFLSPFSLCGFDRFE